jgi:hypothetical protein
MRQRINLADLYATAVKQVTRLAGDRAPASWPIGCPFALDQLLYGADPALSERLKAMSVGTPSGVQE